MKLGGVFIIAVIASLSLQAQTTVEEANGTIRATASSLHKAGEELVVSISVEITRDLSSNESLVLVPVVTDSLENRLELPSIYINSRKQQIIFMREMGKKEKHVRYFKARVLDSHQSEGINGVVRDCMEDDAIVFSDKSTSYVDISDLVELHVTEKSDAKTTKETLKWVHIAISNAKRTLLGNYHKIKRKYLQLYLNEFIYKLNRRYFGDKLFDRLVIANITGA